MSVKSLCFASVILAVIFNPYAAHAVLCDFDGDGASDAGYGVVSGVCVPTSASLGGISEKSVYDIAENFMDWFIGLMGFLSIMGFLVSGFLYFAAAGDEERAKNAKKAFWYSVLGVSIALGAFVVIKIINAFLSAGTI